MDMESNSESMLMDWQECNTIELNNRDEFGNTVLTKSLKINESDDFIIELIKMGCDVNISDSDGAQPLQLAMGRPSTAVAQEIINHGANLDEVDVFGSTALHLAIHHSNMEALAMLLCYGADVTIHNQNGETPLMMSLRYWEREMANELIRYYDEFSSMSILKEASQHLLVHSLTFGNDELFRSAWLQVEHELLLKRAEPFVLSYLVTCDFPALEWLECLLLVLASPVAPELIQDCQRCVKQRGYSLMSDILVHCSKKKLQSADRLGLIYLCTSLGATISGSDLYLAHKLYGCNSNEFEALVYTGHFFQECTLFKAASLIPALHRRIDRDLLFNLIVNQIKSSCSVTEVVKALGHFSLSSDMKHELSHLAKISYGCDHYVISNKLSKIPEVPSLLEISRNQLRNVLADDSRLCRLYQFYDAVKNLNLPRGVADVFLFKAPIYY